MRKVITVFVCLLPLSILAQTNHFTIQGHISGLSNGLLYLYHPDKAGKLSVDSSAIQNGAFRFEGSMAGPADVGYLSLKEEKRTDANRTVLFLEPGHWQLQLKLNDFKEAQLSGSRLQQQYLELAHSKIPVQKKYKKQLDSLSTEKDHDKAAAIRDRLEPYFAAMDQKDYEFFDKYPQSYVTAYMLRLHTGDLPLDSLELFYNRLGKEIQSGAFGKNIEKEIVKLRAGSPGSMAPSFTATDINGQPISLSEFKGKYVLLDFWASWCVPCRKENPHLKELYQKYKSRGIEFIGVADDDSKTTAWHKAVEKDGLPWRHVLRGLDWDKLRKGEQNDRDISEKYGIHSLPTQILIDQNGQIIGRYTGEVAGLDQKLAEIFP